MKELDGENVGRIEEYRGQIMAFPGPVVDHLRTVGAFQPRQRWGMFRRPGAMVREETVELGKFIAGKGEEEGRDGKTMRRIYTEEEGRDGKTMRRIYTGAQGTGKSVLLLQAMAMAFARNWIVISIPEGPSSLLLPSSFPSALSLRPID